MTDVAHLETVLGIPLEGVDHADVHVHRLGDDVDMQTTYARVRVGADQARDLADRAGLTGAQDPTARTLLMSGWNVEPGDPPAWWVDPDDLTDQCAMLLEPNGWVVSGYADGWWQVLAIESGPTPEPPSS